MQGSGEVGGGVALTRRVRPTGLLVSSRRHLFVEEVVSFWTEKRGGSWVEGVSHVLLGAVENVGVGVADHLFAECAAQTVSMK